MPSRSSAAATNCPGAPAKPTLSVPGSRSRPSPCRRAPGIASSRASSRSRRPATRAAASARSAAASRAATPKPTMPLTFSVPARRSRSWCPPAGERRKRHAPPQIDRAHALRPVNLVRRQRQRIHAQRVDVDVELPRRLHRVGVKQRARFVRDARQRRDVVDVPQLVVRERQRHQHRVRAKRGAQRVRRRSGRRRPRRRTSPRRPRRRARPPPTDARGATRPRAAAPSPSPREAGRGPGRGAAPDQPPDRQLIPLRPPRREHDLLRARAHQPRNLRARVLDRRARRAPRRVRARRIAGQPAQRRRHRVGHLGPHGRRRIVVQVDAARDAQYTQDPPTAHASPAPRRPPAGSCASPAAQAPAAEMRSEGTWEPLPGGISWEQRPLLSHSAALVPLWRPTWGHLQARDRDSNGVGLFDAWGFRWMRARR